MILLQIMPWVLLVCLIVYVDWNEYTPSAHWALKTYSDLSTSVILWFVLWKNYKHIGQMNRVRVCDGCRSIKVAWGKRHTETRLCHVIWKHVTFYWGEGTTASNVVVSGKSATGANEDNIFEDIYPHGVDFGGVLKHTHTHTHARFRMRSQKYVMSRSKK